MLNGGVWLYCEPIHCQIFGRDCIEPEGAVLLKRQGDAWIATCYHRHKSASVGRFDLFNVRLAEHDRIAAEDPLGHGDNAFNDPALTEVVVCYESAVGLEYAADVCKSLLGKEIAFEPNAGVATVQY